MRAFLAETGFIVLEARLLRLSPLACFDEERFAELFDRVRAPAL